MRARAWIIVILLIGGLYFLSSIPGLRVLPVLSSINSAMSNIDFLIVRLSEWLAAKVPLNFGELRHIDTLTQDFLAYARDNPIIIEFFLRKVAHVVVFFIITIALFFLYHQYIKSSKISVALAFISGGIIAFVDEYRQSFVDGRVGSTVDVFIDMIGVTLATCLIVFSLFLTKAGRQRFYQQSNHEIDGDEDKEVKSDKDNDKKVVSSDEEKIDEAEAANQAKIMELQKRIDELEKDLASKDIT
ncbi:VanZ family protein [Desulfuribacillus alkaliarsenatis]|uniref:VanZ-like domain-containing protein n=1 Tax=Desulfuribacillus alkaliarsenatis TaxID=766136 RepID=A0A1E5G2F0_9FIRM|nr:VanZ family protein [Desulfuribacillus alkaliarsenatis]OEF96711.1 hypothetical protein BHF68_06455 [Desulfuribacillus alkaliarsenatis]